MQKDAFLKLYHILFFLCSIVIGCSRECIDPGETYDVAKGGARVLAINPEVMDSSTSTGLKDKTTEKLAKNNLWFKATKKGADGSSDLIVHEGLEVKMRVQGSVNLKGFFYTLEIPVNKVISPFVANKSPEMNFIPPVTMPRTMRKGDVVNIDVKPYNAQYPQIRKVYNNEEYYVQLNSGYGLFVDHVPLGVDYTGLTEKRIEELKNLNRSGDVGGRIPPTNPDDWQCSFGVFRTENEWRSDGRNEILDEYHGREVTGVTDFFFSRYKKLSHSLCEPGKDGCKLDIECSNPDADILVYQDVSTATDEGDMMCYGVKRTGMYAGFPLYNAVKRNATWTFVVGDKSTDDFSDPDGNYHHVNFSELARHKFFTRCTPNWKNRGWMGLTDQKYFTENDTFVSSFYRVNLPNQGPNYVCNHLINKYKMKQAASRVGGLLRFAYMNDGESGGKNLDVKGKPRRLTDFYDRFIKKEMKVNSSWCFSEDDSQEEDCNIDKAERDNPEMDEQERTSLMCNWYYVYRTTSSPSDAYDNWYGFPDDGVPWADNVYREICDSQYNLNICSAPEFPALYDNQMILYRFIGNDVPHGENFPCKVQMELLDAGTNRTVSTVKSDESAVIPKSLPTSWKFLGLIPKGYNIRMSTDPAIDVEMKFGHFFLGDEPNKWAQEHGKMCGLGTAFRNVPIPKKVCIKGYVNNCTNPYINAKVEREGSNTLHKDQLTAQYCTENDRGVKTGLCVKAIKTSSGTITRYLMKDDEFYVNAEKSVYITNPSSFAWSPVFNVQESRCGLCVTKNNVQKNGSDVIMEPDLRTIGLANSSAKQIMNESQCDRDPDLEWITSYKNYSGSKVTYSFIPNVRVAKCLDDPLTESSIPGSLSYNGTVSNLRMLSVTDSKRTVEASKDPAQPTHLYVTNQHTVPHDSEMLFYIAGDLSDQNQNNATSILTQHKNFKDGIGGYSLSVYTSKPMTNGDGLYMYIQPIDPKTKKPDPALHPEVVFKDKDFFFIRDNTQSFESIKSGDDNKLIRYMPRKTGVMWFIIPDLPPCVGNVCLADDRYDGRYISFTADPQNGEEMEVDNTANNVEEFNTGAFDVEIDAKQGKLTEIAGVNIVTYVLINPVKDFFFGPIVDGERQWHQGLTYNVATGLMKNAYFQMLFYMGLVLTLFMHGFNIVTGEGKPPSDVPSIMKEASKFALIIAFISPNSFNLYQEYFIKGLIRLTEGFGGIVANSLGASVPSGSSLFTDLLNGDMTFKITDENVDGNIFAQIGDVYSYFFEEKTIIRLAALVTYNFPVGILILIAIIAALFIFFLNSFKAVLFYLGTIIGICIYGTIGPIFILAKVHEKTAKAFDSWWKDLLGLVIQQGMFLISIAVFSTIFMESVRGLLRFGVCLEPILVFPIINLPFLYWYTVQGTIPSQVKNFMPDFKSFSFDEINLVGAFALIIIATCLLKFMDAMSKMVQGKAMDFVPDAFNKAYAMAEQGSKGLAQKVMKSPLKSSVALMKSPYTVAKSVATGGVAAAGMISRGAMSVANGVAKYSGKKSGNAGSQTGTTNLTEGVDPSMIQNAQGAQQGGIPQGGVPQGGVPQGGVPQGGVPQVGQAPMQIPPDRGTGLRPRIDGDVNSLDNQSASDLIAQKLLDEGSASSIEEAREQVTQARNRIIQNDYGVEVSSDASDFEKARALKISSKLREEIKGSRNSRQNRVVESIDAVDEDNSGPDDGSDDFEARGGLGGQVDR